MVNLLKPRRVRRVHRRRRRLRSFGLWCVAIIGVFLVVEAAGFFALSRGWTDVGGTIDERSTAFDTLATTLEAQPERLPLVPTKSEGEAVAFAARVFCGLNILERAAPNEARNILLAQRRGVSGATLYKMLFSASLHLPLEDREGIHSCDAAVVQQDGSALPDVTDNPFVTLPSLPSVYPWTLGKEWDVVRQALVKDASVLIRAADTAGVDARLIASVTLVEQLRLYVTQRELFEKVFLPLKVLGNATQQAWGVMSIKEKTALQVEEHLHDSASPYFLGNEKAGVLDLPAGEESSTRFARLTDSRNHYFSYLYGGVELAEFMAQWRNAGFSIDDRPEILATLFNIGFRGSFPKEHPATGGSTVSFNGEQYTFGSLAFELYYSGELQDAFPFPTKTNTPD